ncbi:AlpA family transcriptional regulator [Gammaproteobacteria bacterium 2W06]|nr:AlpA family transcriptional regulator [Gammaproteobacteria bacterium 2W06]
MLNRTERPLGRPSSLIFVSDQELAARYRVHRCTIWRWVASRGFPTPINLSPGCTRWRLSDVCAWEAEQGGD